MAKTYHLGAGASVAGMLVAVGLLMLVVAEARPAGATLSPKPGKIAYQGHDGHDSEIYTISPGGGVSSTSPTTIRTMKDLLTRPTARR
jgi:hypothetical protein